MNDNIDHAYQQCLVESGFHMLRFNWNWDWKEYIYMLYRMDFVLIGNIDLMDTDLSCGRH